MRTEITDKEPERARRGRGAGGTEIKRTRALGTEVLSVKISILAIQFIGTGADSMRAAHFDLS